MSHIRVHTCAMSMHLVCLPRRTIKAYIAVSRHVLQQRLGELAARLEGLQRSFECIQDCVRAYSPRLWHQEFAAFVRCVCAWGSFVGSTPERGRSCPSRVFCCMTFLTNAYHKRLAKVCA